jgi:hypothetical protein
MRINLPSKNLLTITILSLFILNSCSSTKLKNQEFENKSIYQLILIDIKSSPEFNKFKKNNCDKFLVGKYSYSFCSFFINDNMELKSLYDKYCKSRSLENINENAPENLNKYSDKGRKYYIVYFSEILEEKIIVNIIDKRDENAFGYTDLTFYYDLSNKKIDKMNSFETIIN